MNKLLIQPPINIGPTPSIRTNLKMLSITNFPSTPVPNHKKKTLTKVVHTLDMHFNGFECNLIQSTAKKVFKIFFFYK